MIEARHEHKTLVVDILTTSFDDNKSVNYIIKQDQKRKQHLKMLMEYSFDVCFMFGKIYLSDDKKACALILKPHLKKVKFKSILSNLKLILFVIGITNIKKVFKREAAINKLHPENKMFDYLWFIGVYPQHQHKGIGSKLMNKIIIESTIQKIPIYLETSVSSNVAWYEKFGFTVYQTLKFGYHLFCMKKDYNK